MNLLFEEDGSFKAGQVLSDNDTSLQVEMPSGKRGKIKASQVLLRFEKPTSGQLLELAGEQATGIEKDFLWACAGDDEFSFLDFAKDYYGHPPQALESTAILLALHAAPIYFHRKGRGRFRKAPQEILASALAAVEKKRLLAGKINEWTAELAAFRLPPEIAAAADSLLYAPDRNTPACKALEAACAETALSSTELLFRCGAIRSPYDLHYQRFLREHFSGGVAFPPLNAPHLPDNLPKPALHAFSIDDASTTEIDDALSVTFLDEGKSCIGIHIAAPGLAILHGSPEDGVARGRLSTVYMPGDKITMLPDAIVQHYTLQGNTDCAVVSLYLIVDAAFEVLSYESRVEEVHIAANLRHHDLEPLFNEKTIAAGLGNFPFSKELLHLWHFANAAEKRRGQAPVVQGLNDYNFSIKGDVTDPENCRVQISERQRGTPLDKLVAELMITTNTLWGGLLAEKKVSAIYRGQQGGKVRMTTTAQPHEGLGVPQYAWMTSPLRRYCDLVNQRQLIACLEDETPPFAARSTELFGILRDFEMTYATYAEFQRKMERYWCLRYLQQEKIETVNATIRRDQSVKIDNLPLLLQVSSLPAALSTGQRVALAITDINLLAPELNCRFLHVLAESPPDLEEKSL